MPDEFIKRSDALKLICNSCQHLCDDADEFGNGICSIFTALEAMPAAPKGVKIMENMDFLLSEPIKYAENGVSQCWTCKNCVGHKEFRVRIYDPLEIRYISVLFPECKIADLYMAYTTDVPCRKFEVIRKEEENG